MSRTARRLAHARAVRDGLGCRVCNRVPKSRGQLCFDQITTLFDSNHLTFELCCCRSCGQLYLYQFQEITSLNPGFDTDHIWVRWMPLLPQELAIVIADARGAEHRPRDLSALSELMHARRRLIWDPTNRFYWSAEPCDAGDLLPPG